MKRVFSTLVLATVTLSALATSTQTIAYSNERIFETGVYQARLIAELSVPGGQPYLVFSGLGCEECDMNRSVFIRSSTDGPIEHPELSTHHLYPGKYRDFETGKLVETVRMFVGKCASNNAPGVVWFLNTKLENGAWQRSAYLAQVEGSSLVLHNDPGKDVTLKNAQSAVSKKSCREVQGELFTTEP